MRKMYLSLIVAISIMFLGVAHAQVKDKSFKDWTVYSTTLQGKKACYVASFPKSKSGNYKRRDEPYFLVTRINDNVDEVSASSGYKYKTSSNVKVSIDNKNYKMFTKGELAWAPDSIKDSEMIKTMKKKNFMNVRGTSVKGTYSIDKYSLSGFTAAYDRMKSLCNKS